MRTSRLPASVPRGRSMRFAAAVCSFAIVLAPFRPEVSHGQTLNEALTASFAGNPGLDAERARQRADQETIKQERAKGLPSINLDAHRGGEHSRVNSAASETKLQPEGYALTLTQPLFRGLRTWNGTKRAKAEVKAGEAQLHEREQKVLLDTVAAYMDVLQDRKIAKLRQDNVDFLTRELTATRSRHRAGDLSKTDVAQARTRLFEGEADLAQARADADASEAAFEAIVGRRPGALVMPRVPERMLPPSLDAALGVAESTNPVIISALYQQEAARRAKREAYGALLPTVSLELSHGVDRNTTALIDKEEESSLFVRMKMPLYHGGDTRSRIRQSRASESGAAYEVTDSRRRTRAGVIDAWKQYHAARARIRAAEQQVSAARQALQGVKIEVKVGERALFELLDAQRELVNGEVALARSVRDHVVSSYALLAAAGRLTARYLQLPVYYPDPDKPVRKKNPRIVFKNHKSARRESAVRAAATAPIKPAAPTVATTQAPPVAPLRATARQAPPPGPVTAKAAAEPAAPALNPLASLRASLPAD